jgi:hypothetical protein
MESATNVSNLMDLIDKIEKYDVIGIDEGQFVCILFFYVVFGSYSIL